MLLIGTVFRLEEQPGEIRRQKISNTQNAAQSVRASATLLEMDARFYTTQCFRYFTVVSRYFERRWLESQFRVTYCLREMKDRSLIGRAANKCLHAFHATSSTLRDRGKKRDGPSARLFYPPYSIFETFHFPYMYCTFICNRVVCPPSCAIGRIVTFARSQCLRRVVFFFRFRRLTSVHHLTIYQYLLHQHHREYEEKQEGSEIDVSFNDEPGLRFQPLLMPTSEVIQLRHA